MSSEKNILNDSEYKILSAFADTLIPPSDKIPYLPSELKIPEEIEESLHYCSPTVVKAFRFTLRYLDTRAFLFRSSMKRFSELPESLRQDFIQHWQHSSRLYRRTFVKILEGFVYSTYYAHPEVIKIIGYQEKLPNKTPSKSLYQDRVILEKETDETIEADACIIGTGAGGAPMAYELAKAGLKVVILEEGGRFDLSNFQESSLKRTFKMYRDGGVTSTIGVPPILIPLGKTIGGTTTINSGTCFRTPEHVFKKWQREHGLTDLTLEALDPYYKRAEEMIHVTEVPEELLGKSALLAKKGLEKMGLKGAPLRRNIKGCEGAGLCCFGCPTDGKQSVQLNYIPKALEHGATLYAHCKVEKLIQDGDKIQEIQAQFTHPLTHEKGKRLTVRAKTFIVSAGAVSTPLLLKESKVGLQSGQVGKNLTIHPATKVFGLFDEELRGWEGVPQSYYSDALSDQGITLEGIFTPPSVASVTVSVKGKLHKEFMENYSRVATFGFMIEDESRGRIWKKPSGEPLILYSMNQADLKKMIEAIVVLSKMFFEAGARALYLPIHQVPVLHSIEEVSRLYSEKIRAKDLEAFAFHPLGTCRMGVNPSSSVVNSNGKVHNITNLYISDGSIFPTALGVNPQVTIMAFSTRMAEHILNQHFS